MNLKNKIARKALSWLVSIVMIVSAIGFDLSFSTFANEQQEIDFCIDKMKNLPTDDEFLDQMRKLPTEEDLNQSRHEEIFHSDGSKDSVDLDEKEVYEEIKKTVDELTKEFEIKESAEEMLNFADKLEEECDKEKIQTENSNDLPAKMQKADAIYRWVAENIHYDFESRDCDKTLAKRKPQDAYFVFSEKTGVCEGYARLLNLMMRMAEIPCMYVHSIPSPATVPYNTHAFNAVYLKDQSQDRKGWTLLDSCWASPHGSDGDAQIKIYLDGEMHFSKRDVEDALAAENDYTNELFDEFKISENGLENPSQELINDLNKKIPDILQKLNEKYKDSPHFETIEFFDVCDSLYFKYKTDLTAEQAKQAKDKLKELNENRAFEYLVNQLTGKSKIDCTYKIFNETSNNMTIEDLKTTSDIARSLLPRFKEINDNNEKIENYCNELEKIYIDLLFPNLNEIEEKIEKMKEDLNKKLEELNETYSDITTIKNINLCIEKDDEGFQIFGEFDAGLTEQDLETRFEQYKDTRANKAKELKFEEFFPAFYKKDQSFKEANESIFLHGLHKISTLEDFGPPDASSIEAYLKINSPALDGRENEAKLSLAEPYLWSKIKGEDITEKVYKFFNKITISDDGIKFGDSSVYHNTHNLEFSIPGYIESLTIEGDATIDTSSIRHDKIQKISR